MCWGASFHCVDKRSKTFSLLVIQLERVLPAFLSQLKFNLGHVSNTVEDFHRDGDDDLLRVVGVAVYFHATQLPKCGIALLEDSSVRGDGKVRRDFVFVGRHEDKSNCLW